MTMFDALVYLVSVALTVALDALGYPAIDEHDVSGEIITVVFTAMVFAAVAVLSVRSILKGDTKQS